MSDDEIEALIRQRLERRAEAIDPRPHFERIQAAGRVVPFVRRRRSWVWAAAAAVLLAAGGIALQFQPTEVAAESIVREVQAAHRVPLDRCYLVEMRREPGSPPFPSRPDHSTVRLWTRGDRFWLESDMPGARWAWGRDADGGVWLTTFGGRTGVRLDADEVPSWMAMHCDMNSLQLDTMLDELLRDFDVRREARPDASPASFEIIATPKRGLRPPLIRRVVLEVDAETRVIRRAVVSRGRFDQLFATTTYTLVDSDVLDDVRYTMGGHLRPGAEVFSKENQPQRRTELFTRFFGASIDRWMRPPPKL